MENKKRILKKPVGNGLTNDEDDVKNVKFELAKRNFYVHPVENGIIDQRLTQAIKDFQKVQKLKVDGLMNPDGETEAALIRAIDPTRVTNLDRARREQIINDKHDFKFRVVNPAVSQKYLSVNDIKNDVSDSVKRSSRIDLFEEVTKNDKIIQMKAKEYGLDPDLLRSVAYLESTHGYYDRAAEIFGKNDSIRPMNVRASLWGNLGYNRDDLYDPEKNIDAGARIIKGIQDRTTDQDVAVIGTLYNDLDAKNVSAYGHRIRKFYDEKPWRRR